MMFAFARQARGSGTEAGAKQTGCRDACASATAALFFQPERGSAGAIYRLDFLPAGQFGVHLTNPPLVLCPRLNVFLNVLNGLGKLFVVPRIRRDHAENLLMHYLGME